MVHLCTRRNSNEDCIMLYNQSESYYQSEASWSTTSVAEPCQPYSGCGPWRCLHRPAKSAGDTTVWYRIYYCISTSVVINVAQFIDHIKIHYSDVIMCTMASQITSITIFYTTIYSGADQRKHQSSGSLAFVRGIHWWPVNSPHKGPITPKMFLFDDVIMIHAIARVFVEINNNDKDAWPSTT